MEPAGRNLATSCAARTTVSTLRRKCSTASGRSSHCSTAPHCGWWLRTNSWGCCIRRWMVSCGTCWGRRWNLRTPSAASRVRAVAISCRIAASRTCSTSRKTIRRITFLRQRNLMRSTSSGICSTLRWGNCPEFPIHNNSLTPAIHHNLNIGLSHRPYPTHINPCGFYPAYSVFLSFFRTWETEHLNPAWEFETKLGTKVRAMLDILHHPINMSHLAKLFSAQLIISFNFDVSDWARGLLFERFYPAPCPPYTVSNDFCCLTFSVSCLCLRFRTPPANCKWRYPT